MRSLVWCWVFLVTEIWARSAHLIDGHAEIPWNVLRQNALSKGGKLSSLFRQQTSQTFIRSFQKYENQEKESSTNRSPLVEHNVLPALRKGKKIGTKSDFGAVRSQKKTLSKDPFLISNIHIDDNINNNNQNKLRHIAAKKGLQKSTAHFRTLPRTQNPKYKSSVRLDYFNAEPEPESDILDLVTKQSTNKENDSPPWEDPEVSGGFFQGDIAGFTPELYLRLGVNWHVLPERKWTDGIVPYHISPKYLPQERIVIERAISALNFFTCLKFIPYDKKSKDYILIWPIEKPKGCWSFVGRRGGQQIVSIEPPKKRAPKCLGKMGKPIHELLHAIGIFHEQTRPDRDQYITIEYDHIKKKYLRNFDLKEDESVIYDYPYDYNSVMHYGSKFFSKDGEETIIPKTEGVKIGQRDMMSRLDCIKVNSLYGCLDEERDPLHKYRAFCDYLAL